MTEIKWDVQLSVTESNNVGEIKPRQNNNNSELIRVKLTRNSEAYDLTALKVFFVTHFQNAESNGVNKLVQKEAKVIDAKKGIFEFIFDDDCMFKEGRQEAYFEVYDYDKFLDATQRFYYVVQPSSRKMLMDASSYIDTWENWEKKLEDNPAANLQKQIDNQSIKKADIVDVDNKLQKKTDNEIFVAITADMQRQIESTQAGMVGEYNSEAELKKAYPNGAKGYAVVWFVENGNKVGYSYTYKNNKWIKGQVWNGMGIPDESIGPKKIAKNAITPEKSVAINSSALVLFDGKNQYAKLNKDTNIIDFPQGGVRLKNTNFSFQRQKLDISKALEKGSYLTLFFNIETKLFEIYANPQLDLASLDNVLVCVVDLSQDRIFGDSIPLMINDKISKPILFGNFQTMWLVGFDDDIFFDWDKEIITIPAITNAIIQNEYLTRPDITSGQKVEVFMSRTSKEQVLVFNKSDKLFKVIDYNKVSSNVLANDVIIAIFSTTYKKIVGSLNYRTSDKKIGIQDKQQGNALFTSFNDYINFDFYKNIIEIPILSYLIDGNDTISHSELTHAEKFIIQIPNNDNKEFLLVWNKETSKYELIIFKEIKTKLTSVKVVIAYFSLAYKKVSMVNGVPFKINGFLFDDKNNYIIPEYFRDEIQRLYEDVQKLKSIDTFTFAFITDIHNELGHIYNFVDFCNRGLVDVAVNGGDTIIVEMVEYLAINHFKNYHQAFSQLKVPYYGIRGNHDASVPPPYDVYTEGMMSTEFANRMIYNYPLSKYNERTKNGYYYVDDDERKIRMVYTNSCEGKTDKFYRWDWSNEQLKWIAEKALNMTGKEDYHVIVFGHINPLQKFSFTVNPNNGEPLLEMLQSFKNGTTYQNSSADIDIDFKNSHKLIGFIFGHTHQDALDTTNEYDINLISTVSSLPDYYVKPTGELGVNKSWERPKDTKNEDGWDVFIVNTETRNVKIRRFGAGENREFDY